MCLRYTDNSLFFCAIVLPTRGGIQIRSGAGSVVRNSDVFGTLAATSSTWIRVQLSIDAAGVLRVSANGTLLGSWVQAASLPSGHVAVGTVAMSAAFDNIVVTQP